MNSCQRFSLLLLTALLIQISSTSAGETGFDRYVNAPDDSYQWNVVSSTSHDTHQFVVIDMVSQTWRTTQDVNRTKWQHWIRLTVPHELKSETGFVMIGGGSNDSEAPTNPDPRMAALATSTGTVVAELGMIPNQRLIFHNDGEERGEDNLIGYTWDQFMATGDATWLARCPMVKSVVRAMDTVTEFMASDDGGKRTVNKFVVAGGSKRGWTTWLTGAVDDRVVGMMPIVIDVSNSRDSLAHHFAAYGFWAPSVGDYVRHRILSRLDEPRYAELMAEVDPHTYFERLTMPKYVINAAGDQFFLPDSSRFYWEDLPEPKSLRYIPNTNHGLGNSDVYDSLAAFYWLVLHDKPIPSLTWSVEDDGTLHATASQAPQQVLLWQATNPLARDFRLETLGPKYVSTELLPNDDGTYTADVPEPDEGWTAYFIEATFDTDAPELIKATTGVQVTPDVLPFAGKDRTQPASLTVTAVAQDERVAGEILSTIEKLVASGAVTAEDLSTTRVGRQVYINWRPPLDKVEKHAIAVAGLLKDKGCEQIAFQLESGLGATIAPGLQRSVTAP
ncbi:MAG: PhoPQ-activated pathogenicity-related family protein [Planctomycetaceae bacterium]|nr:PhoPQ-activated pathogenicity-related family protein [Planctomycetaceae bacterium]